ncbi:MAG: alpha/beta fold hydrolase [Micromonosporaceae bacterium]
MTLPSIQKSTIVRATNRLVYASIRAGFRAAEVVAPRIGAAVAEWLWWRVPAPPRARPFTPPGERFQLDVSGSTVVGRIWGNQAGASETVYLLHGWGGRMTQFAKLVPALLAEGFQVVALDAPSHGESGPGRWGARRASIPEFADALTTAVAAHGPAYAVIAHSLGCPAVGIALRDGLAAKRLVFLAPAGRPSAYTHQFARRVGFGERIRQRMQRRLEERVGLPIRHFDLPELATELAVPPLLVLHDRADRETRYADGAAITETWPGSRLVPTEGLGHNRILADADVIEEAVAHLTG